MPNRRNLGDLKRRAPTRNPKMRILLVCEGEKTERIYFSMFLAELRAANVSLEIAKRECGSDPLAIVRYAKNLMRKDPDIDYCYCVIDRDSHSNFESAVREGVKFGEELKSKRLFRTIASHPCFEVWFILHFAPVRFFFAATGRKSAAECVVSKLKSYLPSYRKSDPRAIASLLDKTDGAIRNAELVHNEALSTGEPNPSTEVHLLVTVLRKYDFRAAHL